MIQKLNNGLTHWITIVGILVAWNLEILHRVYLVHSGFSFTVQEFFSTLTNSVFTGGILIMIPLVAIVFCVEFIASPKKGNSKKLNQLFAFGWLILSSPFIYWSMKNQQFLNFNLVFMGLLLVSQFIRYRIVKNRLQ